MVFIGPAICSFVLRPEAPVGVYATVKMRMPSPRNANINPEKKGYISNHSELRLIESEKEKVLYY